TLTFRLKSRARISPPSRAAFKAASVNGLKFMRYSQQELCSMPGASASRMKRLFSIARSIIPFTFFQVNHVLAAVSPVLGGHPRLHLPGLAPEKEKSPRKNILFSMALLIALSADLWRG
ncbi:MAG: hypothetical protein ACYC5N_04045, partial [Endomicrobiales bacterium]